MKLRFLGTGTSVGVPQIGCSCATCTSSDPRDKRKRCAVYLSSPAGALLVDTPPELRIACLEYGVSKVDALLLTHAHMDHVAGFDDMRRFNTINGGRVLECRALPETIAMMHHIFPYIGTQGGSNGLYRPQVAFAPVAPFETFEAAGFSVRAVPVEHGFPCCGYIFSQGGARIGYVPDCHVLPPETLDALRGVDVMVLNCLREREHSTHLTLERSLAYLGEIAPGRAYITHMCHDLSYAQYLEKLPAGVLPAFDGLEISA